MSPSEFFQAYCKLSYWELINKPKIHIYLLGLRTKPKGEHFVFLAKSTTVACDSALLPRVSEITIVFMFFYKKNKD